MLPSNSLYYINVKYVHMLSSTQLEAELLFKAVNERSCKLSVLCYIIK